jgi:hypothetical protein
MSRHPLPESREARHNEIPESDEREKGRGDDGAEATTPNPAARNPDGEFYRYDDLGRGPGAGDESVDSGTEDLKEDQREHQDRGQGAVETDGR